MRDHQDIVLQSSPEAKPAVDELYTYLMTTYLPRRFPTMFTLHASTLQNLVTGDQIPTTPHADPVTSLRLLGANLDENFTLLLPSDDGDGYVLKAYILCFPSGFDMRTKHHLKLRDIHAPVPGYASTLARSMDRYFAALPAGKIVARANWAVTTHADLFAPSGTHLYAGDAVREAEVVEARDACLRSERQMLWRLPGTGALVFSFKTYLDALREIREEGLGAELVQAIEGLREGSVPQMHFYKRGVVWGEAVKAFLRS